MAKVRCGAKSRQSGEQCRNYATAPCGKCRFHGGATPRGIASPNFKHGIHSKAMPKHLKADYNRAASDPKLLSLRSQVALLGAREMELTKQLSSEGPPWGAVVDRLVDCEKVLDDQDAFGLAFAALRKVIREGSDKVREYEDTWADLRQLVLEKSKLTAAEHKRLETLGGFLKIDDVMGILVRLLNAVRVHVEDRAARQAIQVEFDRIIDAQAQADARTEVVQELTFAAHEDD